MRSPSVMTYVFCPYAPAKPVKVILWLVQDERAQVMKSVLGSPVQQAFHCAVRSLMRKYAVSVPEAVFPVPKQPPVISTVWVAVDPRGPAALILGAQGPVAAGVGAPLALWLAPPRCIAARTAGEP